ncbi:aquaporin [Herbidospora daliensis]|uniref:aquaporin n=1 Tax=Herbidospora daliensis TaxID=295585 RepID=UPI000AF2BCC1|nr:aquaporin [Herbidospora daliensis]
MVGSGIQADRLSADGGVALPANSLATDFGLGVLIVLLGPVSGAFNPVVTRWHDRRSPAETAGYMGGQITGAIAGAMLANTTFGLPPVEWSSQERSGVHLWLAETVATAGLLLLITGLARTGRSGLAAPAVASYIGAAYWFTSSTSYANPAVIIGRTFTDTYAGIAPSWVAPFIAAQVMGLAALLFPQAAVTASALVNQGSP